MTSMLTLDRFIYLSTEDLAVDSNGFAITPSLFSPGAKLLTLDKMMELNGGILVAEGGMGKSSLLARLHAKIGTPTSALIELILYKAEPTELTKEITRMLDLWEREHSERPCIILDGLDEAPGLTATIIRLLPRIQPHIRIWLSSRSISEIQAFQSKRTDLKTYAIAPLSEQDVRDCSTSLGIDSAAFMEAVEQKGIGSICSKPLGCEMVLREYASGGTSSLIRSKIWESGMRRLCDETPSASKQMTASHFTLDEVFK